MASAGAFGTLLAEAARVCAESKVPAREMECEVRFGRTSLGAFDSRLPAKLFEPVFREVCELHALSGGAGARREALEIRDQRWDGLVGKDTVRCRTTRAAPAPVAETKAKAKEDKPKGKEAAKNQEGERVEWAVKRKQLTYDFAQYPARLQTVDVRFCCSREISIVKDREKVAKAAACKPRSFEAVVTRHRFFCSDATVIELSQHATGEFSLEVESLAPQALADARPMDAALQYSVAATLQYRAHQLLGVFERLERAAAPLVQFLLLDPRAPPPPAPSASSSAPSPSSSAAAAAPREECPGPVYVVGVLLLHLPSLGGGSAAGVAGATASAAGPVSATSQRK
jgi:hypothetical protein